MDNRGEILIYQARNGKTDVNVKLEQDTVWLTQKQIAVLFGTDRSVITKHLRNIIRSGELDNSVCAKFAHTAGDGKVYTTTFYNLDAIISVGYRVNSMKATQFRIWATTTLKTHITRGVTFNEKRLQELEKKVSAHGDSIFTLYHNVNKMILKMPRKDVVDALADDVEKMKTEINKVLEYIKPQAANHA